MTTQGKRLKNIRHALKLTQEELGAKLGISKQFYSNIETDRTLLNNEKLELLHKDYNVNLNYLVCGEGSMFNKINNSELLIKKIKDILKEDA